MLSVEFIFLLSIKYLKLCLVCVLSEKSSRESCVAGSKTTISSSDLRATDVDSEDSAIIYTLTKNPIAGSLHYHNRAGEKHPITKEGPHSTFTQEDIDKGKRERTKL